MDIRELDREPLWGPEQLQLRPQLLENSERYLQPCDYMLGAHYTSPSRTKTHEARVGYPEGPLKAEQTISPVTIS